MDLNLNDTQLAVLQWIADGCDLEHPPSPAFKQYTVSLRNRGLIELDRRKGHWSASLDPKGQFYLDHGHHPALPWGLMPKRKKKHAQVLHQVDRPPSRSK